ncbi:MAG TPA: hypothetical protein PKE30_11935 [Niabella sp.]|nr:hypothetical protein [Niabella sp.]
MEIVTLGGKDEQLYHLVAHLVMDEAVLAYNLNYPYKTSPDYRWYIGTENGSTIGFIPVKLDGDKAVINNYYIADDDSAVLTALVKEIIQTLRFDFDIEAVVQIRHVPAFEKCGFPTILHWKRYVKMKMDKLKPEGDEVAQI